MPAFPLAILAVFLAGPALAHTGHAPAAAFTDGLIHPFTGLDHVLAMVAVGLCAAVREGRALLLWPLSFVAAMAGGFWLAETGMALPAHETLIALSVLGLGLVLLAGLALPILPGALVMGAFALAHGYAHGLEATSTDSLPYVAGFGLASLLLHLAGMALVLVAARFSWRLAARQAGAAIAPVGALLVLA